MFQVVMFGVLGWFYLVALPDRLGLPVTDVSFSTWDNAVGWAFGMGYERTTTLAFTAAATTSNSPSPWPSARSA